MQLVPPATRTLEKVKSLSAMEIGYHVSMLRGTNLVQQDSIPENAAQAVCSETCLPEQRGKYGNLPGVRQTSLAMPEPATRGEELEGGSGGCG